MSKEKINLSEEEEKVINAMDKTLSFEEIIEKTGISHKKLDPILEGLLERDLIFEVKK